MKAALFFMVFLLSLGMVAACHTNVYVDVDAVIEGLTLDLYCGENLEKTIVIDDLNEFTKIQDSWHQCFDDVTGVLKYNGEVIDDDVDTPEEVNDSVNEVFLSYTGITEVPEFGTIGAGLALIGAVAVVGISRKR